MLICCILLKEIKGNLKPLPKADVGIFYANTLTKPTVMPKSVVKALPQEKLNELSYQERMMLRRER